MKTPEHHAEVEARHSLERMVWALAETKDALRKAILTTSRVSSKCIDYDPAGSTYEVDWLPQVKEWATLADLDLQQFDPYRYEKT